MEKLLEAGRQERTGWRSSWRPAAPSSGTGLAAEANFEEAAGYGAERKQRHDDWPESWVAHPSGRRHVDQQAFKAGDTDRGSLHGVAPGQRFAIYRDFRQGRTPPLVYLGDVVAMTVNEQTTKVVVVKAVDGIMPGDVVVPRRPANQ